MNGYPKRWLALHKGVSVEFDVRKLIARVSHRLSATHGVRLSMYPPALDIDSVDMVIRLSSPAGTGWTMFIEAAVRSSSGPNIALGSNDRYGTLRRWLGRSERHRIPCLLFHYRWGDRPTLTFYTPDRIRHFTSDYSRSSVPLPDIAGDVEQTLFQFFASVASAESEAEARRLLL